MSDGLFVVRKRKRPKATIKTVRQASESSDEDEIEKPKDRVARPFFKHRESVDSIQDPLSDDNESFERGGECVKDDLDTKILTKQKYSISPSNEKGYKGLSNAEKYIETRQVIDKKVLPGPRKIVNTNVRAITIIDYQPDVCKDYKETGYCGYGDNCKFLHEREDYKQGWEIDRDWEIQRNQISNPPKTDTEKEPDDTKLPFACFICREKFTKPIETRCGHYFCESCALNRYAKTPTCAVCGSDTKGIFNRAFKLIQMQKRAKES